MERRSRFFRELPLHLMIIPSVIVALIYSYGPMLGSVMAFQDFNPVKGIGSQWVGLRIFIYCNIPGSFIVLWNTVYIAFLKY